MGDDGEVAALERRQGKNAADGGELLAREATYDASLTEQGLDSRIATGNGTRMAGGGSAATLRGTGLDGGNATALADETGSMEE